MVRRLNFFETNKGQENWQLSGLLCSVVKHRRKYVYNVGKIQHVRSFSDFVGSLFLVYNTLIVTFFQELGVMESCLMVALHDTAHQFCGLFVSPFEISCFDSFEAHRFPFFEPGEFKSLFFLVIVLLILKDHIVFFLLRISIFHLQQNRIDSRVFRRCPCRLFLSSFLPEYRSS